MSEERQPDPVQFPNYPQPQGLAFAERKQSAPLFKMIKSMVKPKMKIRGPKTRTWKKRLTYY